MVAQRLDIPCYYKEMVAVAAKESGLAQEFISGINSDENAVMRELYLTTDPVQRAIAAQEKAIREIADKGACVIIGRSADYVLRDYQNVVRIFIYAPKGDFLDGPVSGQYAVPQAGKFDIVCLGKAAVTPHLPLRQGPAVPVQEMKHFHVVGDQLQRAI